MLSKLVIIFYNTAGNKRLDHKEITTDGWKYCVFGKITDGMDAVDRISIVKTEANGPLDKNSPLRDVIIRSISVIETE